MLPILAILAVQISGAPNLTVEDVKAEYPQIFSIQRHTYGEKVYLSFDTDTLPTAHPLAGLVNDKHHFLLYLVEHGAGIEVKDLSAHARDSVELRTYFLERLRNSARFDTLFLPIVDRYLRSRGGDLVGYEPPPRKQVALEDLMRVAVRFFYPDAVLPDGTIQSHICVGINGLRDFPGGRDPLLEAFGYSAIFQDLLRPRFNVEEEYDVVRREMNELGLSTDPEVRLARAQGFMWGRMMQSERLRDVLRAEYRRLRDVLPFELVETKTAAARLLPEAVTHSNDGSGEVRVAQYGTTAVMSRRGRGEDSYDVP